MKAGGCRGFRFRLQRWGLGSSRNLKANTSSTKGNDAHAFESDVGSHCIQPALAPFAADEVGLRAAGLTPLASRQVIVYESGHVRSCALRPGGSALGNRI